LAGSKSGDYHDDMNATNFERWLRTKLIPNLPPNFVLVLDNASYHNIVDHKEPTNASKKCQMIEFLCRKNIPHDASKTKPELYKLVKENKTKFPDYRFDKIQKEYGHEILRLPPYSPEFNPIEKAWGIVKNWVATHNTTFKLKDVEELTRRKFNEMSVETWQNVCRNVVNVEKKFIEKEHLFDDAVDHLQFAVNTGSSDA
jgi:transposase